MRARGIDVDVPTAIKDPTYSETERLGDFYPCVFDVGIHHMNGSDALCYARSRFNNSDLDRIQRVDDERRCLVLHGEPALPEPGQVDRGSRLHQERRRMQVPSNGADARFGESRLEILDARTTAVGPQGHRGALGERLGRVLDGVARVSTELPHGPLRQTGSDRDVGVGLPLGPFGDAGGDAPQDRVHEAALLRMRERHGLGHRCVRGDPREQDLVRAEAEQGQAARARVGEWPVEQRSDQPIDRSPAADRAVRELRGEGTIPRRQVGTLQCAREREVRVGAMLDHASDDIERDRARGRAGRHPTMSPSCGR